MDDRGGGEFGDGVFGIGAGELGGGVAERSGIAAAESDHARPGGGLSGRSEAALLRSELAGPTHPGTIATGDRL